MATFPVRFRPLTRIVEHGGEDRADHERGRAQIDREEEREDRARGAVDLEKSAGPERYQPRPTCTAWNPSAEPRRAEQRRRATPGGAGGGSGRAARRRRTSSASGTTTPKHDPEPERLPAEGSSTFSLTFGRRSRASRPPRRTRSGRALRARAGCSRAGPGRGSRATPPSNTTASVFWIDDITPVAPHSASPRADEAGEAPRRRNGRDQRVEPGRPLGREVELGRRSPRRDPAARRCSTKAPGRGSSPRTSRGARARTAPGTRSRRRTGSRRAARSGRPSRADERRAYANGRSLDHDRSRPCSRATPVIVERRPPGCSVAARMYLRETRSPTSSGSWKRSERGSWSPAASARSSSSSPGPCQPERRAGSYEELRRNLGRSILLGLEVLIVADIVRTIVIDQTSRASRCSGVIVLIRILLSFSLEVEMDGTWPWNRWRRDSGSA